MARWRENSICYMSLADAFLTRLRKEIESRSKSRMMKGISVEVVAVTQDRQDFIYDYLTSLYDCKKGTFSKPKSFSKQTIYECERSNPCKGSSTGDPTKTRANGCSAYVSFLFEEGATITACIIRSRLKHNGHDPTNREESRVSRIDLSLRFLIETHLNAGTRVSEIMSAIAKWNKVRGYTDHHNRRYFPTRQDIQQLAFTLKKPPRALRVSPATNKKPRKYDTIAKDNATRLLRTEMSDWCIFHQSRTTTGSNPRPLIVVLQSESMRENLIQHGRVLVCIEKNYDGLRQYGNAVYVLAVHDEDGDSHAVAYIISSDDDPITFTQALQELQARCLLNPRVFLMDQEIRSFSEMLVALYPDTQFLVPWFQVAKEVHKWLQNSQVSGTENTDVRKMLLHYLQELKGYSLEEEFMQASKNLQQRVEFDAFTSMMQVDWLSCHVQWSDHGREVVCGSNILSAAWERFFLKLQHQFLKGLHTRRTLPDLLKLITGNITQQRNVVNGLLDMSLLLEGTTSEQAGVLIKQGWPQLISWQGEWVAHVPCHTILETSYRVNLVTMECECPALIMAGPCVHLCLVATLAQVREGPSIHQERHRLATEAYNNSDYVVEAGCCVTFHSDVVCVTELTSGTCTCVARLLDADCVGVLLTRMVENTQKEAMKDVFTKEQHLLTFTLNSHKTERERCLHLQESPIIIQIHTGLYTPSKETQQLLKITEVQMSDLEAVVVLEDENEEEEEEEERDNSTFPRLSTQAMIQKLYQWSRSKNFVDSDVVNSLLQAAHDSVWGSASLAPSPPPQPKPRTIKAWGNKKLRAVMQPVVREKEVMKVKDEEEELARVVPPTIVTRSGRTIKVKDEPDFVM